MNDELNYYKELRSYLTGFILALLLTIVPFALVAWGNFPSHITLIIIAVFGLIQVIVQFHYFLHIDFSRQKREDLQLILFRHTAADYGEPSG
ncbi:MAG: cytochrome C oxidase subunit IV family protein [Candidatus Methanofishera endochildressiae]|uniref:Cytochrome bo(3) ubiquinol oxidase subunit 4 n=1 Tax=Candidatus Methanofishera endochildressiae TaxID=2738884 RepID=A0A7Z0MPC0_9GAMM|nr:cytochrome C oxidase subunit IV family protein [Candidatus Methanofishera endochildressiae]